MKPRLSNPKLATNAFCGRLIEIPTAGELPSVAILENVTTTKGHFHRSFDELYVVFDGWIDVHWWLDVTEPAQTQVLGKHQALIIPRWAHHKIAAANEQNRVAIVSAPRFDPTDETASAFL